MLHFHSAVPASLPMELTRLSPTCQAPVRWDHLPLPLSFTILCLCSRCSLSLEMLDSPAPIPASLNQLSLPGALPKLSSL